jgi:hypothetical protein
MNNFGVQYVRGCTMPQSGQKPGQGYFKCTGCDEFMLLTSDDDELPPCPYCKSCDYVAVDTPESLSGGMIVRRFYSGYF